MSFRTHRLHSIPDTYVTLSGFCGRRKMPWQECSKVDERLRFVARLLEGEKMAVLCREFDISRKTGHKIFNRYKDCGLEGLTDRSRRPYRQANRLPFQVENLIVQEKGAPDLGSAEDPREDQAASPRDYTPGHQYGARGPGSARTGRARPQSPLPRTGHDALHPH